MSYTYKEAGVDLELGDNASKILFEASKKTWANRKGKFGEIINPFDDFAGARVFDVSKLPEGSYMCLGFDGIGTKMEIAERIGKHDTVAYDLLAMVCDDAVVRGGEPVIVGSVLDINTLDKDGASYIDFVKQLAVGYINAAKQAGVAIINGEMAELGARISGYGDFNYSWSAGVIWVAKKERMFTGKEIKAGDKIVGLREEGFRSNGLSLLRYVLKKEYGDNWHEKDFDGKNLGEEALKPSTIYSKAVCEMFGGFDRQPEALVHGVAHITGGGLPGKLGRVLRPSGLGAEITDPFEPPKLMKHVQEIGGIKDEEAYRTWCMGQGMVVITPQAEKVIEIARNHGIHAKVIGKITEQPDIIVKTKSKTLAFKNED